MRPGRRIPIQRKGHALLSRRLRGREPEFVERALLRGVSNVPQLSRFTSLSEHKIRETQDRLRYSAKATNRPLPANAVERMLINGELSREEIAKIAGVTPKAVSQARYRLVQNGIPTRIPHVGLPPMVAARMILRYEVLMQVSGKPKTTCALKADIERYGGNIHNWLYRSPTVFRDAKTFASGRYWAKAKEQLGAWIKAQERIYGKKYSGWRA